MKNSREILKRGFKIATSADEVFPGGESGDFPASSGDDGLQKALQREVYKTYLHAPAHLFRSDAIYFITSATLYHKHIFNQDYRKVQIKESLDFLCTKHNWDLIAWVILSNHYHIMLQAPINAEILSRWIADLHKYTAKLWNDEDRTPGRQVWYEYWDTCITFERSFYARLNYIHWNPVRHGYVENPEDYCFSSYMDYLAVDEEHTHSLEKEYPWDRVKGIKDDF